MEAIIYKVINLKTLAKKIKLNISNSLFKNIISHYTLFCSTNKNLSTLLSTKFRLCNKFVAEKNPVSNFNFYIQKEKGSDSKIMISKKSILLNHSRRIYSISKKLSRNEFRCQ